MAVFYIDPVNGSDAYSGKAFGAPELAGTDGEFGADYYHFISDAGGFTGMVGKYIRVNSSYLFLIAEVISDTQIRTATAIPGWSAPIPFAIGGAFRTLQPLGTGYYTVNPGDEIRIAKTPYCDPAGPASMTYTNKSKTVTFASGRVKIIEQCESGWVAGSGDVTVAYYNYYFLQGGYYLQVKPAYAFTTGKLAYKTLTAELDLSDFQGISFGMKNENDLLCAGYVKVCLCSDTTGDVIVDEFLVQPKAMYPPTPWYPTRCMKSGGGNLGATINSIAIYALVDGANVPFIGFDNFIAIRSFGDADHLCHGCILTQTDEFPADHWGIESFDSDTTLSLTYAIYGVDGAQDTYTRETYNCKRLYFNPAITGPDPILNPIVASGGWDPDTDVKNGLTVISRAYKEIPGDSGDTLVFGYVHGIKLSNMLVTAASIFVEYQCNYITLEDIVLAPATLGQYNYGMGIYYAGSYIYYDSPVAFWTLRNIYMCGGHYGAFYNFQKAIYSNYYRDGSFGWVVDGLYLRGAGHLDIGGHAGLRAKNVEILWGGAQAGGLYADAYCEDIEINGLKIREPGSYGIDFVSYGGKDIRIINLDSSGASTALINAYNVDLKLLGPVIAESTKFANLQWLGRIARINDGGTAGVHVIDTYYGRIVSEAAVRHTASGIAWKLSPTNTPKLPLKMKVATVAVKAGIEIAVSLWMRRTNTGLLGRLFIPGGYVGGIETEASTGMGADSADVYRQYTLTVTPTEDGVIEAWTEAQGGTTYSLYVDDFAVV